MKTVILHNRYPADILTIVKEMEELGWVNGVDFEWRYTPARLHMDRDWQERYTTFTFMTEECATYFSIKWS